MAKQACKLTANERYLRDNGYRAFFYYKGRATVCLLIGDKRVLARGIAMCHEVDQFVGKTGRDKALGRAIQAWMDNHEKSPAYTRIRGLVLQWHGFTQPESLCIDFHGESAPVLTPHEKELVKGIAR